MLDIKTMSSNLREEQISDFLFGEEGDVDARLEYQIFVHLYKVYVRPHLEFCVQAWSWSPYLKADKEKLEEV